MGTETETESRAPASLPLHISLIEQSAHTVDVAARLIWWSLGVWLFTRTVDVVATVATTTGDATARLTHWRFFDGYAYVQLAQQGYHANDLHLAAYFPLYSLLIHTFLLIHIPWEAAAVLISNSATLLALILVALLVWRETQSEQAATWAAIALGVSPLGVFLAAMYSDSLFLALAAGALLTARSGHWRWAGVALALAVVTRPFGLALALALILELLRQRVWRQTPWLLLPPTMSLGIFLGVLWHVYNNPLITIHAETTYFGHAFRWPWQTLALTAQQIVATPVWSYREFHILLDLIPVIACILCVALLARQWPATFSVYLVLIVALCLTSPVIYAAGQYAIVSDGRYCYAAAPLFIPLGRMLKRWRWQASSTVLLMSLAVQGALTVYVLHGGWLV